MNDIQSQQANDDRDNSLVMKQEAILEEFRTLRQEFLGVQNARVWGTLTYVIMTGGVAALQSKSYHPFLFLFLIWSAIPLLWYTANRERSRIRIGAYIKAVIEPQVPGLEWEAHLAEWREAERKNTTLGKILGPWRYNFALTGVYVVIIIFSFILLLDAQGAFFLKLAGFIGLVLCVECHIHLQMILTSMSTYEDIFQKASRKLSDSLEIE